MSFSYILLEWFIKLLPLVLLGLPVTAILWGFYSDRFRTPFYFFWILWSTLCADFAARTILFPGVVELCGAVGDCQPTRLYGVHEEIFAAFVFLLPSSFVGVIASLIRLIFRRSRKKLFILSTIVFIFSLVGVIILSQPCHSDECYRAGGVSKIPTVVIPE